MLGRYHELGGYLVENDYYGQYYPAARAILDGQPMMNPRSGPGYPLLLAGGTLLGFDTFTFGKAVASVALAAAGWFTFLTVRALTGAAAGLVAQLFVYAILFRYGVIVGNDLPFVALAFGSTSALRGVGWLRRHSRHIQIVGGVLLLAVGTALVTGVWEVFIAWIRDEFVTGTVLPI